MITCFFEGNKKAQGGLRHVTVNALVIKDGQILLGRRGLFKGEKMMEYGKWGLLGGYLNRDETLIQAVVREIREETGCEVDNLVLFRINDRPERPREDRQNVDVAFIAQLAKQIPHQDEEITELKWFPLDALPPGEEIAFDHGECIELYKEYIRTKHPLPLLG